MTVNGIFLIELYAVIGLIVVPTLVYAAPETMSCNGLIVYKYQGCPDSQGSSDNSSLHAQSNDKANVITIDATVKPDHSNEFIHDQFAVKTFKFITTDQSICPGVTLETLLTACKYSLENGEWRANKISPNMFVFDGTLKASSNLNSKFFDLRADLTRTAESTASGHLVQNLTGTVSFGNGVADYGFAAGTFDATNNTLKLGGASLQ